MGHTWAKRVGSVLTPFRFPGLFPCSGSGESKLAADNQLLERKKVETRPAGENLKRLRKLAGSADKREGVSLKGLSRQKRRQLLAGQAL